MQKTADKIKLEISLWRLYPAIKNPTFIADNVLNRDFHADGLNRKWVTDVTEFKYGTSFDHIHKLYLSVILDLCDHRPVAYVLSNYNNNQLVFNTFDQAVKNNLGAHPIFHSDRGFQYISRAFHRKLIDAGMTQSMSPEYHTVRIMDLWRDSGRY